jgi:hypothetical protein
MGPKHKMAIVSETGLQVPTAVVMKSTIFWDITPCSPLKVNRHFGGKYRLNLQGRKNKPSKKPAWNQVASRDCFHAGFLLGLFSNLKMGGICSSEISLDFQRTTRRYIPEDITLLGNSCNDFDYILVTYVEHVHK